MTTPVTQAAVLVGGRGTRLGELTKTVPKPMLPIAGRPFLEYLVQLLVREGFTRVLFCSGHLAGAIRDHFRDGVQCGIHAEYSEEPEPMGTGGALRFALDRLDSRFLVLNGDTIFDIPMRELPALLAMHYSATAAMALRQVDDVSRYGSVRLEGDLVRAFEEKGGTGPGWINGGIYCLDRAAIEHFPVSEFSLERDLFPKLAERGRLCARRHDGYFLDIGLPETLERAQRELPARYG